MKVTVANVTKMSEDVLYQILEQQPEGTDLYLVVDAELDRRARINQEAKDRKIKDQARRMTEMVEAQGEMERIFEDFSRGFKMNRLVYLLGEQFRAEYVLDEENCRVQSNARKIHEKQNDVWIVETPDAARHKLRQLIYWRVYNAWMRDACPEKLSQLKTVLGI